MQLVFTALLVIIFFATLLFVAELVGAFLWRFLPLSKAVSAIAFTLLSAALLTPVPVGVGVGAMIYPIFILYNDAAQLDWHLRWYANDPVLVVPSLLITCAFAFVASYRLLPNRTQCRK